MQRITTLTVVAILFSFVLIPQAAHAQSYGSNWPADPFNPTPVYNADGMPVGTVSMFPQTGTPAQPLTNGLLGPSSGLYFTPNSYSTGLGPLQPVYPSPYRASALSTGFGTNPSNTMCVVAGGC